MKEAIEELAQRIKDEGRTMMSVECLANIGEAVFNTRHLKGELAEVGTWKGGSVKLIHLIGRKPTHGFDTFEGLPKKRDFDHLSLKEGDYPADFEEVKAYLKPYKAINLYKGVFPDTTEPIKDKKFSFVHLDADFYDGTLQGLKFFYPRMVKGGIIMLDDYPGTKGIDIAVDEFLNGLPKNNYLVQTFPTKGQGQFTNF